MFYFARVAVWGSTEFVIGKEMGAKKTEQKIEFISVINQIDAQNFVL